MKMNGERDVSPILRRLIIKGGPGSGHFDHEGRPGQVGGSVPSGVGGRWASEEEALTAAKGEGWERKPAGANTGMTYIGSPTVKTGEKDGEAYWRRQEARLRFDGKEYYWEVSEEKMGIGPTAEAAFPVTGAPLNLVDTQESPRPRASGGGSRSGPPKGYRYRPGGPSMSDYRLPSMGSSNTSGFGKINRASDVGGGSLRSMLEERGGPGSGHFGHAGRPGQRGGSQPSDDTTISQAEAAEGAAATSGPRLPSGQASVEVNFALRDTLYRPAQGGPPLTSEQLLRYQEQAQIAVDRWAEAVGIYPDGVTITNDTDAFVGGATYRNGMPMPGSVAFGIADRMEAGTWGAYEENKDSLWLQDVMPSSRREFVGDTDIFQDTVAHELGHRMEAEFRDAIRAAVGDPPARYADALKSQLGYEGKEVIRREYIADLFRALTSTMAAGGAMPNLYVTRLRDEGGLYALDENDIQSLQATMREVARVQEERRMGEGNRPALRQRATDDPYVLVLWPKAHEVLSMPLSEALVEEQGGAIILNPEEPTDAVERGGPGSGHFGHEGRPGQRGGSAPGDGETTVSEAHTSEWILPASPELTAKVKDAITTKPYTDAANVTYTPVGRKVNGLWDAAGGSQFMSPDGEVFAVYSHWHAVDAVIPDLNEEMIAPMAWRRMVDAIPLGRDEQRAAGLGIMYSMGWLRLNTDKTGLWVELAKGQTLTRPQVEAIQDWLATDPNELTVDVFDIDQQKQVSSKGSTTTSRQAAANLLGLTARGGPGSGHFGHEGRPGQRGGSAPSDEGPEETTISQAGATSAWSPEAATSWDARREHESVPRQKTLPDEYPFSTWAHNRSGYSNDTFESVYQEILSFYGDDSNGARMAAEYLRNVVEENEYPMSAPLAAFYGVSESEGPNKVTGNVQMWLDQFAEENKDETWLEANPPEDSEDEEGEPEEESAPVPELEARLSLTALGMSEAIPSDRIGDFVECNDHGEETYAKSLLSYWGGDESEPPSLRDYDIQPSDAERIQGEVQELVESITKAYDDTRTRTGELTSPEVGRDDMLVVGREIAEGEWGDINMDKKAGIAAGAIWQTMMRSREGSQKSEQTYRAYALRDGDDPIALLTVEDVSLPDETGNTDFDPEAMEAAKVPDGDYLYVHYLASQEERQGHGTYLMTKALQMAAENGQGIMGGAIDTAKSFYEKLGATFVNDDQYVNLAYFTPEQVTTLYENMGKPVMKAMTELLPEDEPEDGIIFVDPSIIKHADERRAARMVRRGWDRMIWAERGGPGSGFFAHEGRPGQRGGSLPGGFSPEATTTIAHALAGDDLGAPMPTGFKESDLGSHAGVDWKWHPDSIYADATGAPRLGGDLPAYWRVDIKPSMRPQGYRAIFSSAGLGVRAREVYKTIDEARQAGADWISNQRLPGDTTVSEAKTPQPGSTLPMTKTAIGSVLQWSSSRYNEFTKSKAVDMAARVLTEGKDKAVFESGNYTEAGAGVSYGAYLVNGPESYIAGGVDRLDAAHTNRFEGFEEKVRWNFRRPNERSLFGILRRFIRRGGPGSGHFGHEGRPGQRGGSAPGEGETTVSEAKQADGHLLTDPPPPMPKSIEWHHPESGKPSDDFQPLLFHGTVLDHAQDIARFGLLPQVGEWVSSGYARPLASGEQAIPATYFAGPEEENGQVWPGEEIDGMNDAYAWKSIMAIRAQVGILMGKEPRDVTVDDIRENGLLVGVKPSELGNAGVFVVTSSDEEDESGDRATVTRPVKFLDDMRLVAEAGNEQPLTKLGPEDGDYITYDKVTPTTYLYGDNLVRWMADFFHRHSEGQDVAYESGATVIDEMQRDFGESLSYDDAVLDDFPSEEEDQPEAEQKSLVRRASVTERRIFIPQWLIDRGGPGSGHFGHEGRPGQRGGSLPGDETSISEYRQPREPEEPPTGGRRWNPTISITKRGEVRKFVASKMSEALGRPISVRTGKVEEMYDWVRGQSPHGVVFTDDRGNGLLLQAADGGAYGFDPYKIAIGGVWTFKVGEPTYKRDEQGKPIFQEGVPGSGSGLGTAMFNALKEYVDAAGKELEVYSIANQRFFSQERFPWMVGERGDLSREYVSPILKAEREARSAAG